MTLKVKSATGTENSSSVSLSITDTVATDLVTITGVPAGWSLNEGTNNGDGSWNVAAGALATLAINPPAEFYGTIVLSVASTTSKAPQALHVTIDPVATSPNLSVTEAVNGNEDTAIALNIAASPGDSDDTLSIKITGVANDATLSAGTNDGNGTWTLTPAQLAGLTLDAGEKSGTLHVTATDSEGNSTAQQSADIVVTVNPVAEVPTLTAPAALNVGENKNVALTIAAAPGDHDDTLSIAIAGVPADAKLSAGTDNGNGSWTLTRGQLAGLKLIAGEETTATLVVTATASEGSSTASTTTDIAVTVIPVAEKPTLTVQGTANGDENTAIALNIAASPGDSDDALSIKITGVASGATLSAGTNDGNGTWTLTPAQLAGLTLDAGEKSGTLHVTATDSEGNSTAQQSADIVVTVNPVAEVPTLTAPAALNVGENKNVALTIAAAPGDHDDTLSITIAGVPADAKLSAGTDNGNGSWTLTRGQLAGLRFDAGGTSTTLIVTATASEGSSTASNTTDIAVTVAGTAPTLTTPTIGGTAQEGSTLTASATSNAPIAYAWYSSADNDAASIGSGATYQVQEGDEGFAIEVRATATNSGATVSATSAATSAVLDAAPTVTTPTILGTAQEGQTLTASASAGQSDNPVAYAWYSSADNYAASIGSGATYQVQEGDEGFAIEVRATATNEDGATVSATSAATSAVLDAAPTVTTPTILGTAQEGQTLTASASAGQSDNPVAYAWYSSADNYAASIGSGATYQVQEGDEGFAIEVRATATNEDGATVSATSAATSAVLDAAPTVTTPTILGTAQEGQTLTASASAGQSDNPVAYAWYSSADNYAASIGSGATYQVQEGDEGFAIEVRATATNEDGATVSATSAATSAVLDAAASISVAINANAAGGSGYSYSAINDPNAYNGTGVSILNNAGQVIGLYDDTTPQHLPQGFLFDSNSNTYTTIDPSNLGNGDQLLAFNDNGQVVGTYGDYTGLHQAVFLYDNGAITAPAVPEVETNLTGEFGNIFASAINPTSEILGINKSGLIVGNFTRDADDANGLDDDSAKGGEPDPTEEASTSYGFIYDTVHNTTVTLDVPGAVHPSVVNGSVQNNGTGTQVQMSALVGSGSPVNDKGQVWGEYSVATSRGFDYFLYDPANGGTYTTIHDPNDPADFETVLTLNNAGQLLGSYTDNGNQLGFIYDSATGQYTDINAGIGGTSVRAINDNGQVIGTYSGNQGFLYDSKTNAYTTIDVAGASNTTLVGINNAGVVIGQYSDNSGSHEFAYDSVSQTFTSLDDPAANPGTMTLRSINDAGQVLGLYVDTQGQPQYFLADPASSQSNSGAVYEGQTLTAGVSGNESDDNLSYTWYSSADNYTHSIGSGATYQVAEADEGFQIEVTATASSGNGVTASATSAPTAAVTDIPLEFTSTASISGTAQEGQVLTAASGTLNDTDAMITGYQWTRDGANISGATGSTYTVTEADETHVLRVIETATDGDGGPATTSTSVATSAVLDAAPAVTTPTITGMAQPGQTLTASASAGQGDNGVIYQWMENSGAGGGYQNISGAIGAAYMVQAADAGYTIEVVATAINDNGTTVAATSAATAAVTGAPMASSYAFTAVDDPAAANGSYAVGLNDSGVLLGYYNTGAYHGFTYQNGSFTAVDDPSATYGASIVDGSGTRPDAINNSGEIIGSYWGAADNVWNVDEGFMDVGGVFTEINPLLGQGPVSYQTAPKAINNSGEVVGFYADDGGHGYGFSYNGSYTTVGSSLNLTAVNDSGAIAGYRYDYGSYHGYHAIVDDNGVITQIQDGPNSTNNYALAINSSGEVTGYFTDNTGANHGFTYDNGIYGTFDAPGATNTYAVAINYAGAIAGYYTGAGGIDHGFVYSNGVFTTVDDPSATNGTTLVAINSSGEVAGNYTDASGQHAFVAGLSPVTIAGGTTTEIDAVSSAAVMFAGAVGTLQLDQSQSFAGTVAGFGGEDQIDLVDVAFATLAPLGYAPNNGNTGGILTASDGTHVANIALLGQYVAGSFAAASDGHGGTLITDPPLTQAASLTAPHA